MELFVGVGILWMLFVIIMALLSLAVTLGGTVLWIWMIVDCATHEPPGDDKLIWILIIIFTHVIGALLYLFLRRPARKHQYAQ